MEIQSAFVQPVYLNDLVCFLSPGYSFEMSLGLRVDERASADCLCRLRDANFSNVVLRSLDRPAELTEAAPLKVGNIRKIILIEDRMNCAQGKQRKRSTGQWRSVITGAARNQQGQVPRRVFGLVAIAPSTNELQMQ